MEETKNTENLDEVLDENEEVEIEEPAKESKFKKAVSKAKDKIKEVKVTTVLKAVAVGAGLVLSLIHIWYTIAYILNNCEEWHLLFLFIFLI